ncbi:hypothetical protein [Bdellovibrio sp. NC01]|uniref:hypothetical protein n=1 Tax=Bdellovibrio sp. NC01 TaxID=2220073 RepID=UPI0011593924|nr:hypothetical protein [Bdellovibrio sp. NC01]QDK36993.1 hypothetical protein DOE51_04990 [Bdellovibrio sp. NC01]
MSLFTRLFRITAALLLCSTAMADVPQELQTVVLEGNLYGRSSLDFNKNAKNITSLIPEGSTGTVIETRKLKRTGSYGVKVRLSTIGKDMGKTTAKKDDEVWVYYSQKDPWLSFQDKKGEDIQDPESALTTQAKRDGEGLKADAGVVVNPTLPTKRDAKNLEKQKEEDARKAAEAAAKAAAEKAKETDPNLALNKDKTKTEGGFQETCTTCQTGNTRNVQDLSDVSKEVAKRDPSAKKDPKDPWADDPYISGYENSKVVEKTIKAAKRLKAKRSKRLCYKYVKNALLAGDMIDSYPPGGFARQGVSDLKAQGMVNLLDNPKYKALIKKPEDAPKGAVLVYRTGSQPGHIEIKSGKGSDSTYISDYESSNNIQKTVKGVYRAKIGKPYELIGVMILPPEKL